MHADFSAVLSTVGFHIQEQILHDWLSALMGADPLDPWFKEWMAKHLGEGSKVRSWSHGQSTQHSQGLCKLCSDSAS